MRKNRDPVAISPYLMSAALVVLLINLLLLLLIALAGVVSGARQHTQLDG